MTHINKGKHPVRAGFRKYRPKLVALSKDITITGKYDKGYVHVNSVYFKGELGQAVRLGHFN